jgi:putative Holliday junction resolvase
MSPVRRGVRLAVDVGSVRVGVAKCDADGALAVPLTVLAHDCHGSDLTALARLVGEHRPLEVVVGLPRSLSGAEGAAARAAREYARRLAAAVPGTPVRLVDERLSTVEATRRLQAAGQRSRKSRRVVDAEAAAVILNSALDVERGSGRPPGELVPAPAAR